jgi:hypothetical protein
MTELITIMKEIARSWILSWLNRKAAKLAMKLEKTQNQIAKHDFTQDEHEEIN